MTAPLNPLASVEAAEQAADRTSTTSLAKSLAKTIAQGLAGDVPPVAPGAVAPVVAGPDAAVAALEQARPGVPTPPPAALVAPPGAPGAAAAPGAPGEETVEEEQVPIGTVEEALREVGIDLGVTSADVPPELMPVYERLVSSAADVASGLAAQQIEASDAVRRVTEFQERLASEPDKVLLTLAVTQPQVWDQVAAIVEVMKQDPAQRDLVLRELETSARERELNRREALQVEATQRSKARQVIAETHRVARKYGVDNTLAERIVASVVTANGGDLDPSEVDGIVAELRPQAARPKLVIRTAAQAAAAAAAPSLPAAPAAAPPSAGLTPARERQGGGGIFSKLVRAAVAKVSSEPGQ